MSPLVSMENIEQARELIYQFAGIHLPNNKNSTIKNRLERLARELRISDYILFFKELRRGKYKQEFINVFTTNKTDFFREGFHFTDLLERVSPHFLSVEKPFRVLCAASSTGEEAYSAAATLLLAKEKYHSNAHIDIQAVDIDTSVLEIARAGKYLVDTHLNPLPKWIELQHYFDIKEKSEHEISMCAKQILKDIITFKQCNLYTHGYPFGVSEFDVIFCRNVLIYFKVEDQKKILYRLFRHLRLGGTIYLGHSESILDLAPKVRKLGKNIFVKVVE